MTSPARAYITPEEYLAREREAEYKSEYFNGEIFAMAGATRHHNLITVNIASELRGLLRRQPCEVYSGDMRVKVSDTGLYTYPDVVVACGEIRFEDDREDILLDPTVIVEVLSPSTEVYDRGAKSAHYRRLEALQEYVLVAQDRCHVERYVRHENGEQWLLSEASDLQATVRLEAIGCELSLADIYDRVEFPPPTPRGTAPSFPSKEEPQ